MKKRHTESRRVLFRENRLVICRFDCSWFLLSEKWLTWECKHVDESYCCTLERMCGNRTSHFECPKDRVWRTYRSSDSGQESKVNRQDTKGQILVKSWGYKTRNNWSAAEEKMTEYRNMCSRRWFKKNFLKKRWSTREVRKSPKYSKREYLGKTQKSLDVNRISNLGGNDTIWPAGTRMKCRNRWETCRLEAGETKSLWDEFEMLPDMREFD
jgi:hypothetical protein